MACGTNNNQFSQDLSSGMLKAELRFLRIWRPGGA